MAMAAGSVTIAGDGTETKSDMAEAIYDAIKLSFTDCGYAIPAGAAGVPIKQKLAYSANRWATALVVYITGHAVANIPASPAGDGLQRDADGANPDCLGPAAGKTLSIS